MKRLRAMKRPPDRTKQTLRLPPTIHDRLTEEAKQNGRSLNAEITWRLRQSLDGYRR